MTFMSVHLVFGEVEAMDKEKGAEAGRIGLLPNFDLLPPLGSDNRSSRQNDVPRVM